MATGLDSDPNDGTCKICGESYTYAGMTRHVKSCASKRADETDPTEWLHLRMRASDLSNPPCWLQLAVDPNALLARFDAYLRETWYLERQPDCTSYFDLTRTIYASHPDQTEHPSEPVESMDVDVKDVIEEGTEVWYKFRVPGGASLVTGKVYGSLPLPDDAPPDSSSAVQTLARNHVQKFECTHCSVQQADLRCLECLHGVCRSCAEEAHADHRLHVVDNTPLKKIRRSQPVRS